MKTPSPEALKAAIQITAVTCALTSEQHQIATIIDQHFAELRKDKERLDWLEEAEGDELEAICQSKSFRTAIDQAIKGETNNDHPHNQTRHGRTNYLMTLQDYLTA